MIAQLLWLIGVAFAFAVSMAAPVSGQMPHIKAKIVYSSEDGLYIRELDEGSPSTPLGVEGDSARWSPDGTQIAFDCSCDGDSDIYVINADGTHLRQLTDAPNMDINPVWSPDGKQIVFESWRDTNYNGVDFEFWRDANPNIYVMNADGYDQTRLTDDHSRDQWPVWSPDGRQIAFESNRDGKYKIYTINSDGTDETRLTDYSGYEGGVVWSPNMTLMFTSDRNPNDIINQIYITSADGTTVSQITSDLVEYGNVLWLPNGDATYTDLLDLMYLDVSTGTSARISSWYPYELYGSYDIWIESIEPMPSQP